LKVGGGGRWRAVPKMRGGVEKKSCGKGKVA